MTERKERKYRLIYDDGHDYGEIEYWSEHRNNSKANLEDAKKELARRYGWHRANQLTITQTYLV